ncbi:MAG: hypothetical protein FJZ96_02975 [Chloroflexi bacterium]|nr:hypothetical protein [Chloroflexota bacterium]
MFSDWVYFRIVHTLDAFLWGGELVNPDDLPEDGPAVFVANHLGSLGPIGMMCSIPVRLHPWVIEETISAEKAPDYVRLDFIERELHLKMPLSLWVSTVMCKLSVPFLNRVGCIPVCHEQEGLLHTLRLSVDLLLEDKYLLVFPEDTNQKGDDLAKIAPFMKTVARLGEMYFAESGKHLRFYPAAVHQSRRISVGMPVVFNPMIPMTKERLRIKDLLEKSVHQMYTEMSMDRYLGVPLPR